MHGVTGDSDGLWVIAAVGGIVGLVPWIVTAELIIYILRV